MTSEKSNGKIGKSVETNFYSQIARLMARLCYDTYNDDGCV